MIMKLDKDKIYNIVNDSLDYFNINDLDYKNNCFNTINNLDNNTLDIINILYNSFYIKKESIDIYRNKSIEEIFGKDIPFITNIMLLLGYSVYLDNISYLDNEQIIINKKRIYETLTYDILILKNNNLKMYHLLWGVRLINIKIIEVGRLQYEIVNINPIDNSIGSFIKIHIPGGNKLIIEDVLKSLEDSKYYINKYFNMEVSDYYCSSWLLSPEVRNIVSNDSNIAKFSDLFSIEKLLDGNKDILKFVFKTDCDDYSKLCENTSLQKELKSMLINNKDIHIGVGKLKKC